jgi:hypothetical protein
MGRLTYEEIRDGIENKDCELLTSKDEFLKDKMKAKSKYSIRLSCGHVESISYTDMVYRKKTNICNECIAEKLKYAVTEDGISHSVITGQKGVDYVIDMLKYKFECTLTNEGCKSDILIRPLGNDNWMPLQVKTITGKNPVQYTFKLKHIDYTNIIIVCLNIDDKRVWVFPYEDIQELTFISIGKTNSKYESYECTNDLSNRLITFYQQDKYIIKYDDAMTPSERTQQIEYHFRQIRETKLQFLQFKTPPFENLPYDFILNGLRVQEKSTANFKNTRLSFKICRVSGKKKPYCYVYDDADLYWFHFPDKRHFVILPRDKMLQHNLIGRAKTDDCMKNLCLNTKTCFNSHWISEYIFDYENLDVDKLNTVLNM